MEKAILKTLIYADIFDYPLKAYEIHKWLIGRKTTLRQVEKALGKLRVKGEVGDFGNKIAGKLCINTLLEENRLEQDSKDIYLAHEVLQMKILW